MKIPTSALPISPVCTRASTVEGWKAAEGNRRVRAKINEISREIADEIKRSSDEACPKD
jgi:hypothetical protein